MLTVTEWEDGVALQLDVSQWTGSRVDPRGGLHAVERGDTVFARHRN